MPIMEQVIAPVAPTLAQSSFIIFGNFVIDPIIVLSDMMQENVFKWWNYPESSLKNK